MTNRKAGHERSGGFPAPVYTHGVGRYSLGRRAKIREEIEKGPINSVSGMCKGGRAKSGAATPRRRKPVGRPIKKGESTTGGRGHS